jgi:N-acetylglucosamine-6-phosphate deacetylase
MTELRGQLLLGGALVPGRLTFDGGRITAVESEDGGGADLPVISPGFIELHVHGFAGCDPLIDLAGMSRGLARAGTTTFQPTLFPRAPELLGADAAACWAAAGKNPADAAEVIGLHLEGPFVNPLSAGALPAEDLATPSVAGLRAILGPATGDGNGIRTMTIAPELSASPDLIEELVRSGVRASLGHSLAGTADVRSAARAGATGATHLFNAMGGVHHRDMGLAGMALIERTLFAEIIGDLNHVKREAFELALAARGPEGLCLVSDALEAAGTGCDVFHSHGRDHVIQDGTAYFRMTADSELQLAGSASSQLEMVRKLVGEGVTSLAEALTMASTTPARALGIDAEVGQIAVGARADLIVLSARGLALERVFVRGAELDA